ncbi:uncharacterized protein EHS24_003908 [Apiotrichum porosum]|uniref:Uncharacterized protein n=1 Tax=Apiotrichum porosum TaxID=105984 RepID=A0A427XDJ5_9TREE|nr:uncharacterized protein EHS24_003908 [Apiotrichum porosum]RSH76969.1 hypothetical protein EHS24_003908 [Apiotrichum porosum]
MPKKNSNKGKRKNKARTTGTRQATVEPPVPPNLAEDVATPVPVEKPEVSPEDHAAMLRHCRDAKKVWAQGVAAAFADGAPQDAAISYFHEAVNAYARAIKAEPSNPDPYSLRAGILVDLGALNEAEHDATICLALKPSQHDARFISKIVIFPYPEIYNMEAALSGAPFVGASHLNLRGDSVRKIIVNLSFEPQQNGCGVWWLAQPFWVRGPERWNARTSTAPRCEMVLVVADVALLSTPSEFNRSPTFVEHTWYYFTQSVVAALMTGFHVKVVGFETMIHLFRDATVKPEPTLEELVELCKDQFVRIMHATAVQLSQAQGYLPPPLDYVANHTTFVARNDYKSTLSKGEWEQETREDYGWL